MQYHQITSGERYAIAALRRRGLSLRAIARDLRRAPSTLSRELARNRSSQGRYTPTKADSYAHARRRRSRRGSHLTAADWALVAELLALDWSPEQVAGWLRRHELLAISHETIYVRVWHEKRAGGELWTHLRQAGKQRRKRYGAYDSRGRLAGKRHISERPAEAEARAVVGHWEADTVMGNEHGRNSVITMVERVTGYLVMGKLARHCAAEATARCIELIGRHARRLAPRWDRGQTWQSHEARPAAPSRDAEARQLRVTTRVAVLLPVDAFTSTSCPRAVPTSV